MDPTRPEIVVSFGQGIEIVYALEGTRWYEERRARGRVVTRSPLMLEDVIGKLRSSFDRDLARRFDREARHGVAD